jgi:GNAT superfamily N-acetyltransferase
MTVPKYSIRPAEARDAPELARLADELGYATDTASMARRLARVQAVGSTMVLVAAGGYGLWGWVSVDRKLGLLADEGAEISALVVDGRARECGIGRALVDMVESWAREQGLLRLLVRSNVNRPATQPFYEHLGFARNKSQHVYLKQLSATLEA